MTSIPYEGVKLAPGIKEVFLLKPETVANQHRLIYPVYVVPVPLSLSYSVPRLSFKRKPYLIYRYWSDFVEFRRRLLYVLENRKPQILIEIPDFVNSSEDISQFLVRVLKLPGPVLNEKTSLEFFGIWKSDVEYKLDNFLPPPPSSSSSKEANQSTNIFSNFKPAIKRAKTMFSKIRPTRKPLEGHKILYSDSKEENGSGAGGGGGGYNNADIAAAVTNSYIRRQKTLPNLREISKESDEEEEVVLKETPVLEKRLTHFKVQSLENLKQTASSIAASSTASFNPPLHQVISSEQLSGQEKQVIRQRSLAQLKQRTEQRRNLPPIS